MSRILDGYLIGLDLGTVRTGVARIHTIARIAEPLEAIQMSVNFHETVHRLVRDNEAVAVVVGIPRGLDGQTTEQTLWAEGIYSSIQNVIDVPVYTIDEAGTTKEAEKMVRKGQSLDSVSACIFLEDFLQMVQRGEVQDVVLKSSE